MNSKKTIGSEIVLLESLLEITTTYEEIAATRMRQTRNAVLIVRDFLMELSSIFQTVKSSYKNYIRKNLKKHHNQFNAESFRKGNGKTVYVLISANTGLYGDLMKKTFDTFFETIQKEKCDITIIGKLGLSFFKETGSTIPYTFFNLPDNNTATEFIPKIMEHLLIYEQIFVIYPKFKNVIEQQTVIESISGDSLIAQKTEETEKAKYLFEPSLFDIMSFFENEILRAIFEQTVKETQLAKYAARMVNMDQAADNIRQKLTSTESELQRIKHSQFNKKQLEALSSIAMWK